MAGHHLAQLVELGVQCPDRRDLPGHDGRVGGWTGGGWRSCGVTQHGLDLPGSGRGVTLVRPAERGGDLGL